MEPSSTVIENAQKLLLESRCVQSIGASLINIVSLYSSSRPTSINVNRTEEGHVGLYDRPFIGQRRSSVSAVLSGKGASP
jgi:hypothetical protein